MAAPRCDISSLRFRGGVCSAPTKLKEKMVKSMRISKNSVRATSFRTILVMV